MEAIMKARENGYLTSLIRATFAGEEGTGEGVEREFFRVMSQELFRPKQGLFIYDNDLNFWWPHASDSRDFRRMFFFTGILIGLALFNSYLLNFQLPLLFYKKLLGQDLIAEDLKDIHPDVHRSLKQLLDMDSGVEELGLYFAVEENTGIGSIQEVDLKPNGSEIAVNGQNKQKYVQLYTHYLLETKVKAAFEPLRSGFLEVCQSTRLSLLQPIELEEILCGMRVTNIDTLIMTVQI